jgi:starch phosphorylase
MGFAVQSAKEFKTKDEFEAEAVKHIETTLARSLFNCDEL